MKYLRSPVKEPKASQYTLKKKSNQDLFLLYVTLKRISQLNNLKGQVSFLFHLD